MYYPTSSRIIPCLINNHEAVKLYSNYPTIENTLVAMKTKFNKYWETFPPMFCFASIMDPKYKLLAIRSWL